MISTVNAQPLTILSSTPRVINLQAGLARSPAAEANQSSAISAILKIDPGVGILRHACLQLGNAILHSKSIVSNAISKHLN